MIFVAIILILSSVSLPSYVEGATYKDFTVQEGEAFSIHWETNEGSEITYDVSVQSGGDIDVYIMSYSEYNLYKDNKDFNPVRQHQKIYNANGEYITADDQDYYFDLVNGVIIGTAD